MPRLEDAPIPLKAAQPYERKRLRPWDDINDFKPMPKISAEVNAPKEISKPSVNNSEINGQPSVNTEPDQAQIAAVVKKLCGHQKKLLFYIVEDCKYRNLSHTAPIKNETLRELLNTDRNSVKTTVYRLIQKKVIGKNEGKRGRKGFYVFRVSRAIIEAVMESEWESGFNKPFDNNKETNGKQLPPRCSSLYLETNATGAVDKFSSPEGENVDLEPLQDIGLTQQHLSQIAEHSKLPIEMIQDSIYAFAFDLKQNDKASTIKGSPLNYFMGILRRGSPYIPPENYESPQDRALRLFVERKEALKKRQQETELKAAEFSFEQWLEKEVTEEQKQQFIPTELRGLRVDKIKMVVLREHFMKAVWPEKRKAILEGTHEDDIESH